MALEQHRSRTVSAPECLNSCKQVAGKLQACCKLIGSFLFLLPHTRPGPGEASGPAPAHVLDARSAGEVTRAGSVSSFTVPSRPAHHLCPCAWLAFPSRPQRPECRLLCHGTSLQSSRVHLPALREFSRSHAAYPASSNSPAASASVFNTASPSEAAKWHPFELSTGPARAACSGSGG